MGGCVFQLVETFCMYLERPSAKPMLAKQDIKHLVEIRRVYHMTATKIAKPIEPCDVNSPGTSIKNDLIDSYGNREWASGSGLTSHILD